MNSNQEEKNDLFDEQVNRDHKGIAFTLEPLSKKDQKEISNVEMANLFDIAVQRDIRNISKKYIPVGNVLQKFFDNGQKNELND